jgi:DNA-binding NtrC family response regulator
MKRLLRDIARLSSSELPVLFHGETGAGKELIARTLHRRSKRRDGPFVAFDCAAVPRGLFEVELFGARAGAYTDQVQDRPGVLASAAGGTVLLEGIETLALESQAKLLRVLSGGKARPVGAEREEPMDVRFLCSTRLDLAAEVESGRFREDLLHRLRVVVLEVPPLRERPEDLEPLVEAFLALGEGKPPRVQPDAWKRLRAHAWPGNVRELRNVVSRLRLEAPAAIGAAAVERALGPAAASSLFASNVLTAESLETLKERLERDYILYHYRRLAGRTPELCALLGLNRRQLHNRLKRLGIAVREERRRLGK